MTVWTLALVVALALSALMTLAWWVAWRSGQSGWIDGIWSLSTGGVAALAALAPLDGATVTGRTWLAAACAALWGVRLGGHIVIRTIGAGDDPRYAALKRQWGASAAGRLWLFLQSQAIAGMVLTAAIVVTAHAPAAFGTVGDIVGLGIYALGIAGGTVADRQLAAFRRDPAHRGGVCDVGLWSWSRHPNYWFEWLGWCAWPVMALGSGAAVSGSIALLAPLMMYWLLVHVSGIPPLEAHMQVSRGERFTAYAARTSAFWPRPPRR